MDDDEQIGLEKEQSEQTEQTEPKIEQAGEDGGTESEHDRQEQDRKTSKHRYGFLIVAIIALVVAIAGLATWLILGSQGGDEPKDSETSGESEEDGAESEPESKPEEKPEDTNDEETLGVNDEVVQKLWGQFHTNRGWYFLQEWDSLSENGPVDQKRGSRADTMLAIAMNNLEPVYCKANHLYRRPYSDDKDCFDARQVFDKVYELFGIRLDETANYSAMFQWCTLYSYDRENTEFYYVSEGCSGTNHGVARVLYDIEQEADKLYLYELAAHFMVVPYGYREGIDSLKMDSPWEEVHFYRSDAQDSYSFEGVRVDGLVIAYDQFMENHPDLDLMADTAVEPELLDYKDEVDAFKWTFRKTTEGNYVFEKLEKVEK